MSETERSIDKVIDAALAIVNERNILAAENKRLRNALECFMSHMGMDEDDWNRPAFNQARDALSRGEK